MSATKEPRVKGRARRVRAVRPDHAARHTAAVDELWGEATSGRRFVLAESPPGAAKSTTIRDLAVREAHDSQAAVLTQTNAQADDMVRELATTVGAQGVVIGRLHRTNYVFEDDLIDLADRGLMVASGDVRALSTCDIVVGPSAKWAYVDNGRWPRGFVDEIYQMRSDQLMCVGRLFDALVGAGDTGQLKPWSASDETLVKGLPISPLDTAAATLLATQPDAFVTRLPVTWRLHADAARLVSRAFYVDAFESGATQRGLHLPMRRHRDSVDTVLGVAATSGWGLYELDAAFLPQSDPELVEAIAALVERLLSIGTTFSDGPGRPKALSPNDIAIGVAHRDQKGFVEAALAPVLSTLGHTPHSVVVDTANRLQGRQFQMVIAWHPLSGRRDATAFHLEAGRLCVLMSRHRQACIVVGRGGIADQLEAYPGTDPLWLGETMPSVDGWAANLTAIEELSAFRVRA
jgi:hypothetical protein